MDIRIAPIQPQPTATAVKRLLATDQPPGLGPERRASAWAEGFVNESVRAAAADTKLPEENIEVIRCVALLWHDHLETAHHIAQGIESPDGSWLHGILHRREPDYWNAKYWFRRAGAHPAFAELAQRAKPVLDQTGPDQLSSRLLSKGAWDPLAFVDAVEAALGPRGLEADRTCLRQLQAVELEAALDCFLSRSCAART